MFFKAKSLCNLIAFIMQSISPASSVSQRAIFSAPSASLRAISSHAFFYFTFTFYILHLLF